MSEGDGSWPERLSKAWPFWAGVALVSLLLLLNLVAGNKEAVVEEEPEIVDPAEELVTRDYQTPPNFLAERIEDYSDDSSDPFAGLGEDQEDKEDQGPKVRSAREILEIAGIRFPDGAYVRFTPETLQLTVHNTRENQALVEVYLDALDAWRERLVLMHLHLYAVDTIKADGIVRQTAGMADHKPLLKQAFQLNADGETTFDALASVLGRSGQRAMAESGTTMSYVKSYEFQDNRVIPRLEGRFVGTSFEVDPQIGPDNYTVDVNCVIVADFSTPQVRQHTVQNAATGLEYPVEVLIPNRFDLQTSVSLWDGGTRLIGVGPANKVEGKPSQTMLVFLTVNVVKP